MQVCNKGVWDSGVVGAVFFIGASVRNALIDKSALFLFFVSILYCIPNVTSIESNIALGKLQILAYLFNYTELSLVVWILCNLL